MATTKVMNFSAINVNAINFKEPRILSNGIKMIDVLAGDTDIALWAPQLVAPFGIQTQYKKDDRFEIALQLPESKQFFLHAIEEKVVDYMFENQHLLGVENKSREVIQDKLSSCVKRDKYGIKIVPKLYKHTTITNENNDQIDKEDVTKHSTNDVILGIPSIWVFQGRFGVSFQVRRIKTSPQVEEKINVFSINQDFN
jgi:hypothetical protein